MIKQIKYSFRSIKRSPLLLFVSIPGLIIGLTVFLLLMIYIKHETNYDKHFPNKDRVVRLYNKIIDNNEGSTWPICLRRSYTEIPPQIPEIKSSVQLLRGWETNVLYQNQKFANINLLYSDKEFLDVFGLNLIVGDSKNALTNKNSAIITKSLAKKIFRNLECIGKVIVVGNDRFSIGGVIEDFPITSHFHFDILASMNSLNVDEFIGMEFFTYFLLSKNCDIENVGSKIAALNTKIVKDQWSDNPNLKIKSGIDKLKDIHLYTHADWDISSKGDLKNLYIVGFLAVLILFIAVINYINLYILHGEKRSLEIGIRKSLGASIKDISNIFYTETALITIFSFFIAILFTYTALPQFAQLMQMELSFFEIINPTSIFILILFLVFLIYISGFYPSVYLSRLSILNSIRGNNQTKRKNRLSIISVVLQFSISIFLIVSLLILYSQVTFLKNIPLGFESKNIIEISGFDNAIAKKSQSICEELQKLPFITETARSYHCMGGGSSGQRIHIFGQSKENSPAINEYRVQGGFCSLMKLELLGGRYFNSTKEDERSIIINKAAAKMLQLKNPVGKKLVMHDEPLEIVGLVKDFYYLGHAGWNIGPLAITAYSDEISNIYLKVTGGINNDKKLQISNILKKYNESYIPQFSILEDVYKAKFWIEDRLIKLLFYGTLLAILISFSGMFALSVYNVEKRTKEIGIRKVMGSTSAEIVIKLLKDTLRWVLFSMPISFYLAYIMMDKWLKEFANRIEISVTYFIIGGLIAMFIALLSVSIKTLHAARRNPIESLRYE